MRKGMLEEAEKHLNGRLKSVLILSVLMVSAGMFWTWNGWEEWENAGRIWTAENRTQVILSVWCLLLGIWGIFFSRRRHRPVPDCQVILWHSLDVLGAGWFVEAIAMGYGASAFLFYTGWEEDRVFFVIFALLFSFAAFFMFYSYRKCYILLCNDRIECAGFLGEKIFLLSDVKKIQIIEKRNRYGVMVKVGYRFLSADGKRLFTAGVNMVHVQEFMNCFSDLYQLAALEYVSGKQQEEQEQNLCTGQSFGIKQEHGRRR